MDDDRPPDGGSVSLNYPRLVLFVILGGSAVWLAAALGWLPSGVVRLAVIAFAAAATLLLAPVLLRKRDLGAEEAILLALMPFAIWATIRHGVAGLSGPGMYLLLLAVLAAFRAAARQW